MKSRLFVIVFVASGVLVLALTSAWAARQRRILTTRDECAANLQRLYTSASHSLPPQATTSALTSSFECPGLHQPYVVELLAPDLDLAIAKAASTMDGVRPLAWCPQSCHDGARNVLFEDGTVVALPPQIFEQVLKFRKLTPAQRKLFTPVN